MLVIDYVVSTINTCKVNCVNYGAVLGLGLFSFLAFLCFHFLVLQRRLKALPFMPLGSGRHI